MSALANAGMSGSSASGLTSGESELSQAGIPARADEFLGGPDRSKIADVKTA